MMGFGLRQDIDDTFLFQDHKNSSEHELFKLAKKKDHHTENLSPITVSKKKKKHDNKH